MDNLAKEMDQVLSRLQRAGMKACAPEMNAASDPSKWLSDQHAPWKKLANEKPKGETVRNTISCCRRGRRARCGKRLTLRSAIHRQFVKGRHD